jgi:hypothetical protein
MASTTETTKITDNLLGGAATVELIWSTTDRTGVVRSTDATGEELYCEQSDRLSELKRWYRSEIKMVTKALEW